MAIVNVTGISGINSITAQSDTLNFYTASGATLPISAGALNVGTGASISSPATNVLTLGTNNTEAVRIDSSGRVGIGTTNTDTNLHIQRSSAQNDTHGILKIESTNSTSGAATNSSLITKNKYGWSQFMQWENFGVRVGCRSTTGGGLGDVYLTSGNDSIAMVIKSSGNTGVGTTNPSSLLHVNGDVLMSSLNGGSISGFRNRIINGSMDIFQRATATTIGASSVYALDRWLFGREAGTESARFTVTQEALTTSDAPFAVGITTTMKIDITTASGGVTAAQSHYVMQRIEGFNVSDFAYGTSSAKSCTLSFWLKTDVKTGTMAVSLFNAATRYYVQSISATTSWTKYSLTFPGDTSGSLPNDNNNALQVMFVLSAGSNLQGTANAWTGGFKNSLSGQADFTDSTSNNIYITGVQLEPGTVATPFEKRSISQELALAQRYYQEYIPGAQELIYSESNGASGKFWQVLIRVPMRIAPNVTFSSGITGGAVVGLTGTVSSLGVEGVTVNRVSVRVNMSGNTGSANAMYHCDTFANDPVYLNAEL